MYLVGGLNAHLHQAITSEEALTQLMVDLGGRTPQMETTSMRLGILSEELGIKAIGFAAATVGLSVVMDVGGIDDAEEVDTVFCQAP
jgi:hypothetical protein